MHAAERPLAPFLQGWDYLIAAGWRSASRSPQARLLFSFLLDDADVVWLESVRAM